MYPLDLAAKAGNLSERVRIVAELGIDVATRHGAADRSGLDALDALDAWKIGRLAGRLADKFRQESVHRSASPRFTREGLVEVLSAYRRYELSLPGAPDNARELLAEIHNSWLPTYQAALDRLDAREGVARTGQEFWRRPDVYYGRLAKVCEPFLAELGRRLREAREGTPEGNRGRLGSQLVGDFQKNLLNRFEMPLAWAVEADAKVYCKLSGIDSATATRDQYLSYLDSTFADRGSYHEFFLNFPVLGRWIAHVTALLGDYGEEVFRNLTADADRIGEEFFDRAILEFTSFEPGCGDYHAGARSVARVGVALADGSASSFCYKPRGVGAEAALQELLGTLADDDVVPFATRPVLGMDGYGYEALIPSGRNDVRTSEQVKEIYRELGGYLGIFYVLGGSDLHYENIMVADGHAFVCDAETILGALPRGPGRAEGTLIDSVFRTGLLERPRGASLAADPSSMKISGYAGGEEYRMPMPVPRIDGDRLSFRMSVAHRSHVRVPVRSDNRVLLNGTLVRPEDFADSITDGFHRVYAWFHAHPDRAIQRVTEIFDGVVVRFLNWSTQIYQQLLIAARHPKCLADPLEVDLLTNTVRTFPRTWDRGNVLAEREISSLWRLDVPMFSAAAGDRHLIHDHAERLPPTLELPPLDHAIRRITWLTDRNRVQQTHYIAASLVADEVTSDSFVQAAVDCATRIGHRISTEMRGRSAPSPWKSHDMAGGKLTEVDVEGDLYLGSAGIALFLAYLNELVPRPEFRKAAERAAEHSVSHGDRTRMSAFSGIGGTIYLLTHLHHLWNDRRLLDQAVRLSEDLPRQIEEDRHLDVLHGAAGLIPVLLGLADATGGHGIQLAHRCADRVLLGAEADGDTLSWPTDLADGTVANLTGFAHGAAGFGWSLIALGQRTGRRECVEAGLRAFAYEARHFDPAEQDWYDLRTRPGGIAKGGRHFANAWCNGAAGIGLSRITSWAALGGADETLRRTAFTALGATIRNFSRLQNHTLCHGTSGNSELLLRVAQLCDEPAFRMEANVQVQALWRDVDTIGEEAEERGATFLPGLMLGISGFGMHCLRLAAPERIPSALLLDPPPSR